MTTGALHARELTSADNDQALAVRNRSFGKLDDSMVEWWTTIQDALIAQHRAVGVFDGDRLVAQGKTRPFQQFWGGRPVPMGGIAGIVVAPDYRGRGVGSLLMRAITERSVRLGDHVSALYPATVPLYRHLGWEIAGVQTRVTVDADTLRELGTSDVPVRPGTRDDVDLVDKLLTESYAARRTNGPKALTRDEIEEALTDDGGFSYLTEDGFAFYDWHGSDLVVTCLVALTEATARALWSVVGSGSSVAKKVHAYVSPDDPLRLLLREEMAHETRQKHWMLRVLDAPAAVAARGFADHVSGSTRLSLEDPLLPEHQGTWRLEVEGGHGSLTRADSAAGETHLGPNGLAALYAGTPVHVLRTAGLLRGGSADGDRFLIAAFAGRQAYLLEYF